MARVCSPEAALQRFLEKRFSENMQQIYRRTPIPKCDFNKVALLCNFIEIALRHGCSPVNLLHIFRTQEHLWMAASGSPLLTSSDVYSEPSQISKMEIFAKTVGNH